MARLNFYGSWCVKEMPRGAKYFKLDEYLCEYGTIRSRLYFAKLIDRCVNHKLGRVRTDGISGTNFRPGQTNIKGSDGLSLRRAVLEQRANPR